MLNSQITKKCGIISIQNTVNGYGGKDMPKQNGRL